jgi:hypothetical protein
MTDKPKSNGGNIIVKPSGPDQKRGLTTSSPPQKPTAPATTTKPKR